MAEVIGPNNEVYKTPDWARESTLQKLVELMGGKNDGPNTDVKEQNNLIKSLSDDLKNLSDGLEENQKNLKDLDDGLEDAVKDINDKFEKVGFSFQRLGESVGGFVGKVIQGTVGAAMVILGSVITSVTAKVIQLSDVFANLSQIGISLEGGTASTIARFNELGMSTRAAAEFMDDNAQVMRVMGNDAVPGVIDSFLQVTEQGQGLGLTLKDATTLLGSELSMRTQLFNLGRLDNQQKGQMIRYQAQVNKNQLEYSKMLGVSTDEMRSFVDSVLSNNQMLMANMIRLPAETSAQLTTGVSDFLSAMRAAGGEAGGEIGAAVLEAASMGAIGFSQAAFEFVTVLPSLADNFNSVIQDFNSGLIDGRGAAQAITQELGNLSESEKNRVFLLARAGDQQAQMMAKAIVQFEQSAEKFVKTGTTIEEFQKGMQALDTIQRKLRGGFDALFNNFMAGFGEGMEGIGDVMVDIGNQLQPLLANLFGMKTGVGSASEGIQSFGKLVGGKVKTAMEAFGNFIAGKIKFLQGYFDGLSFEEGIAQVKEDLIEGAKNMMKSLGTTLLDGIKNYVFTKELGTALGIGILALVTAKLGGGIIAGAGRGIGQRMVGAAGGGGAASAASGAAAGKGMTGVAGGMKAMGKSMKFLAVGARAFASPMVIAGMAVITAAIIGIGFALKLAAPGIEAFGKAIKSVFEGIGAVVESVGKAIASVVEAVGRNKTAKINAEAEAMVKTTKATTDALKELEHMDPAHMMGLATGVDMMGEALGNFKDNMDLGFFDTLKQGFAALFGAESPIQAVIRLTDEAEPVKMMDMAKAMMATNAASAGATSLDSSLTQASTSITSGDTTSTTNMTTVLQDNNKALLEELTLSRTLNTELLSVTKKTNTILKEISDKQ